MPGPVLEDEDQKSKDASFADEQWSDADQEAYEEEYKQQTKPKNDDDNDNDDNPLRDRVEEEGKKKLKEHLKKPSSESSQSAEKAAEQAGEAAEKAGELGSEAGGEAAAGLGEGAATAAGQGAGTAASTAGTAAATGAAEAGATAAAEGGALAATEGAVTAAGVATSETGVGAVAAAAVIAGMEAGKELNRIRKDPSRVLNYDKIIEKEGLKWGKWIAYVFIVIFAVMMFIMMIGAPANGNPAATGGAISTLSITKALIGTGAGGHSLTYSVHAISTVEVSNIVVVDHLPANSTYVSSAYTGQCPVVDGCQGTYNSTANTVTWNTKDTGAAKDATYTITIKLDDHINNVKVVNYATGTSDEIASADGYTPPADASSCGGKYASYVSNNFLLAKNYGDPVCSYTKDDQYALLKQQDPQYADLWFLTITPGESGYNPNAWQSPNVNGQAALDAGGAWGLYQMGSSTGPGQPPPAPGKNGQYDRGDVPWGLQTTNAITYNRARHCNFAYWATARAFWYKYTC